jgi:hypothetical protein
MTFEDRQREAMTDFNRSSYSIREMLTDAVKRAQAEADIRRFELEEYLRANGFNRQYLSDAHFEGVRTKTPEQAERHTERLNRAKEQRERLGKVLADRKAPQVSHEDMGIPHLSEGDESGWDNVGRPPAPRARLDASRAYREVTGRDAFAGAETYTRRDAEDIHD